MPIELKYQKGESHFYLQVPFDLKDQAKKVGGVWDPGKRSWKYAVDLKIWDAIKQAFKGQLSVPVRFVKEIERVEKQQKEFLELRNKAMEDNPVDFSVDGISLEGKNPLFNYQKWGIKCGLLVGDGFLIGDAPGLGKSVQALGIALQRKNAGEINNCLIVCLAAIKYNWLAEIKKFTHERAIVIDGTPEERKKKWMASGYFFKIVNYEIVVRDLFINPKSNEVIDKEEIAFRKYLAKSFDMIIVDEIHAIKSHQAQRTKALKQLTSHYRIGLSGTPVDGHLEELHSIFEFLKPGLFESRGRFLDKHAIFDHFGTIQAYVEVDTVRKKIEPYYIRRQKEKVLQDLPEKLFKDVYVELEPKEQRLYKELVKGAHEITEESQAAEKVLRARQFLDFPEILGMHNKSQKFFALADLLEELIINNKEKVLIFTQYKEVLDLILFNLKGKYQCLQIHGGVGSKERIDIVNEFNNTSRYPILIGTDAMSTGLNIGGAHAVIHYEDSYSPAIMQQRNDRAHRATTRHNVTVYRFICKDTIEERVRSILGDKMNLNNQLFDESCSEFGVGGFTNLDLLKCL